MYDSDYLRKFGVDDMRRVSITSFKTHSINFSVSGIKDQYDLEKFHFVELFIFFYDYITFDEEEKVYSFDKESFIMANSNLLSLIRKNSFDGYFSFEEEFEKNKSKEIFNSLKSQNELISLESLVYYLQLLSDFDLSEENLFKILDKSEKGTVTEKDVNELLWAITEFLKSCDECNYTPSYLEDKKEKVLKLLFEGPKKSLNESFVKQMCKRDDSILKLFLFFFNLAEEIINAKLYTYVKTSEGKSTTMNVINLFKNVENSLDEDNNDNTDENDEEEQEEQEEEEEEVVRIKCIEPNSEDEQDSELDSNNYHQISEEDLSSNNDKYNNSISNDKINYPQNFFDVNNDNNNYYLDQKVFRLNSLSNRKRSSEESADKNLNVINNSKTSNSINNYSRESMKINSRDTLKNILQTNVMASVMDNNNLGNLSSKNDNEGNSKENFNIILNNINIKSNDKENSSDKEDKTEAINNDNNSISDDPNNQPLKIDNNTFYNIFLDDEKFAFIEKLRQQSCNLYIILILFLDLYDISLDEFAYEFFNLRKQKLLLPLQKINKQKFIEIFLDIINRYTRSLKIFSKTKALSELFDIFSSEESLSSSNSYYTELTSEEIIGFILILIKGDIEDKLILLFDLLNIDNDSNLFKKRFILMLSAILRFALKNGNRFSDKDKTIVNIIIDSKIVAEAIYEKLINKNNCRENVSFKPTDSNINIIGIKKCEDKFSSDVFKKWLNSKKLSKDDQECCGLTSHQNSLINIKPSQKESNIEKTDISDNQNQKFMIEILAETLNNLNENRSFLNFENVNLTEVIDIFKTYSLLGQINRVQIISSFNELFNLIDSRNLKILTETDKNNKLAELLIILNFDLKNSESFELTEILIPLIILFNGSVEEKFSTVYKLFDEEKDELTYGELILCSYQIFYFALKLFKGIWKDSAYKIKIISKNLIDDIFNFFNVDIEKGVITSKQIIEYYYHLS